MINAEVTAENKPACAPSQHEEINNSGKTDENQGRVQVLVVLLEKFLVVLLGNLPIVLVELCPVILLSWYCVLFRAAPGRQRYFGWA